MNTSPEDQNLAFFKEFWARGVDVYENHPTSRHRRRFVLRSLARVSPGDGFFLFDYGCGSGAVLRAVKELLKLDDEQLGGCDLSPEAIGLVQRQFRSPRLLTGSYPDLDRLIDVVVCTEVIEHTPEYRRILEWILAHLKPGGMLVLTTPGVPLDPPDALYGHTQHFVLADLCREMQAIGYRIDYAARWGWPFFSLQKYVTKKWYRQVERRVIQGGLSWPKRALFAMAYWIYLVHDAIPLGPQIFIRAIKPVTPSGSRSVNAFQ